MSEKNIRSEKKQSLRSHRTHDHFWVKNRYKKICLSKYKIWGNKFLNGHSRIYFALHVFAQPRLGNIFHKVIANHEISWSEPRNLKIFCILPFKSEHPHPECRKLSSSLERLRKQLSGRRSKTELVDKVSYYFDL